MGSWIAFYAAGFAATAFVFGRCGADRGEFKWGCFARCVIWPVNWLYVIFAALGNVLLDYAEGSSHPTKASGHDGG